MKLVSMASDLLGPEGWGLEHLAEEFGLYLENLSALDLALRGLGEVFLGFFALTGTVLLYWLCLVSLPDFFGRDFLARKKKISNPLL